MIDPTGFGYESAKTEFLQADWVYFVWEGVSYDRLRDLGGHS